MSSYAASARIGRVSPRLGPGVARRRDDATPVWTGADERSHLIDVMGTSHDVFVARLEALSERWTQLTFYLFDPQSWR